MAKGQTFHLNREIIKKDTVQVSAIFWLEEHSTKMAQYIFQLFMAERITHAEINCAKSGSIELSATLGHSENGTKG